MYLDAPGGNRSMAGRSKALRRYLRAPVEDDLRRKMVFLGGPRQVGKTTLALKLLGAAGSRHPGYLNWDDPRVRPDLVRGRLPGGEPLVVLDEIHKFPRWRNLVKGLYDTEGDRVTFLVTGSARLDHYRKGRDSLQGRYHHYRLHPFSLGELGPDPSAGDLETLLRFGGFPEPLLARRDARVAPVAEGEAVARGLRGPARSRKRPQRRAGRASGGGAAGNGWDRRCRFGV